MNHYWIPPLLSMFASVRIRLLLFGPLIMISLFALPPNAQACQCLSTDTVAEGLVKSDAVFSGTPIAFTSHYDDKRNFTYGEWTFVVDKIWKGPREWEITVYTAMGRSSCSLEFDLHRSYLIFADLKTDKLWVHVCSHSTRISSDSSILKKLHTPLLDSSKPGQKPEERSVEALVVEIQGDRNPRERLRAWIDLEDHDLDLETVLGAAQYALRRNENAELLMALKLVGREPWDEISPLPFLRSVVKRADQPIVRTVWGLLETKERNDRAAMELLSDAILHHRDIAAMNAWINLGPEHHAAVTVILKLLSRRNDRARCFAAEAIVGLQLSDDRLVKPLIKRLGKRSEKYLDFTAWALGYQGAAGLDPLIELLGAKDEWHRKSAAYGLGLIDPPATLAIDGLLKLAQDDPVPDVQLNAAVALEKIKPGLGWEFYDKWRKEPSTSYRSVEFLRGIKSPEAIQEMIRLLQEPDCPRAVIYGLDDAGKDAVGALPYLRAIRDSGGARAREADSAIQQIHKAVAEADTK